MKNPRLKKIGQKIIGQILFRPSLDSFSSAPNVAKTLEKKFKEWKIEGDAITLFSPEEKKLIQIHSNKITYLNEEDENFEELLSYSEEIYQKMTQHSVNEIRRIGIRNTIILESPFNFSDLVELLSKKLLPGNKEFAEISGNNIKDVAFTVDSERNGFLNHIKIGPVNRKEIPRYFNSIFEDVPKAENDGNIFIDIDVFTKDGLTKENTIKKLKEAIKENESIIDDYLKYIIN